MTALIVLPAALACWHMAARFLQPAGPHPRRTRWKTAAEVRFWPKVAEAPALECWEWAGTRTDSGYGSFWDGQRRIPAHRWAYEALRAPIPDGLCIDHLCRNRACVNPWHLEPVTSRVNTQRGNAGLHQAIATQSWTACTRGHEYNAQNTFLSVRGDKTVRVCRACENLLRNERRRQRRLRGAPLDRWRHPVTAAARTGEASDG